MQEVIFEKTWSTHVRKGCWLTLKNLFVIEKNERIETIYKQSVLNGGHVTIGHSF